MRFVEGSVSIALILSLSILASYGNPVLTSDSNKLEHLARDPEDGINSEEIMPGRHYTEQEMKNMVYLVQAETMPYAYTARNNPTELKSQGQKHQRSKRFINLGFGRTPEERRRLRNERVRLRNERRRLRQESRRQLIQRQQELMRAFFGQTNQTFKRLNNFNTVHQQRVPNNVGNSIIQNPPQQLVLTVHAVTASPTPIVNPSTQTAVAVGTQAQTQTQQNTTPSQSKPVFEQVALPSGK